MKAKQLLGNALVLVLVTSQSASAVQRRVLVEDFTNWNCPPCEAIEDSMDIIMTQYKNAGVITPVRPHVNWPDGCDLMYLGDAADVDARVAYYTVTGVPTMHYDGTTRTVGISGAPPYAAWCAQQRAKIEAAYSVPAAIDITIRDLYRDANTVYCNFDVSYVEAVQNIGATQEVYMAAVETDHRYGTPVGADFEWYVFRGFSEEVGSAGALINLANVGDTQSFQWTFRFDDPEEGPFACDDPGSEESPNKLNVAIWAQRSAGPWSERAVLNSVYAPVTLITTDVGAPTSGVRFDLSQNEPNPFAAGTTLRYALERDGNATLSIYDVSGRLVTELVNGHQPEGAHEVLWNGHDRRGRPVGSGLYYYRLESGTKTQTRTLTVIR